MRKITTLLMTIILISSCGRNNQSHNKRGVVTTPIVFSSIEDISASPTIPDNPPSSNEDHFWCDRYGPFELANCQDFDATFTYELNTIESQRIIERIRLFNSSNSVVASSSKASSIYLRGERRSVTFTIPLRDYFTNKGLTLKFEILNSDSLEILKTYSAKFFPPLNSYITYNVLKAKIYATKSFGFLGDGTDMVETNEAFDFTVTGTTFDIDYYYQLDLSKNYFRYIGRDFPLGYESCTLVIPDKENLFPYLEHTSAGKIRLPLSLYKNANKVTFRYQNKFYVNKKTLQISSFYQDGFVLTDKFYLPINGKNIFNGKTLQIEINRLGYSNLTTIVSLKYDVDKSAVGVCGDGESCIVGGRA